MTAQPEMPPGVRLHTHGYDGLWLLSRAEAGAFAHLFLDRKQAKMLAALLSAPNATEIGAWMLERATELEQNSS